MGESFAPYPSMGSTSYFVQQSVNDCPGIPANITISIDPCDIIIPTAFTPDGDDVNDDWQILHLDEVYPNNIVSVYNRWGNKLFESTIGSYSQQPWDGRFDGKELPVASYYYIIETTDSSEPLKGIVSIVREN
jgi:gliding motility-associated-like protein